MLHVISLLLQAFEPEFLPWQGKKKKGTEKKAIQD
jgi:hypothetical protein